MDRSKLIVFLASLGCANPMHAYFWGGNIGFDHVSGFTYSITVQLYYSTSSSTPDHVLVDLGDGNMDTLQLVLPIDFLPDDDAQMNTYAGIHTYSGPGPYTIRYERPNRPAGILNIPNSNAESFCLEAWLNISPLGTGGSARFTEHFPFTAPYALPFVHDPGAMDPDGDSLAFELVAPLGFDCDPIPGYSDPSLILPGPDNVVSFNTASGTITWDSPQLLGHYVFAVRCYEYRNGVLIGQVTRDMDVGVLSAIGINDQDPGIQSTFHYDPTTATLNLSTAEPFDLSTLELFDALGRRVLSLQLHGQRQVSLAALAPGLYVARMCGVQEIPAAGRFVKH